MHSEASDEVQVSEAPTPISRVHSVVKSEVTPSQMGFDTSRVLAKAHSVQQKCEDEPFLKDFLARAHQIGYQTPQREEHTILADDLSELQPNDWNQLKSKKTVSQRLKAMSRAVAALDLERIQLLDHIESMQYKMRLTIKAYQMHWAQNVGMAEHSKTTSSRIRQMGREAEEKDSRIGDLARSNEQLLKEKERSQRQRQQLTQELQYCKRLLKEEQLKSQHSAFQIPQQQNKCDQLQAKLAQTNKELMQNLQYIFDLEQRVANSSYEIMEREKEAKVRFENMLIEEKKAIEEEVRKEIENLEQEIRSEVINQLDIQYRRKLNKKQQLLEQQKEEATFKLNRRIDQLEKEKQVLTLANQEYEHRLTEVQHLQIYQQQQNKATHQLQTHIKQLEAQLIEKEKQLQQSRIESSQPRPSPRANGLVYIREGPQQSISPSSYKPRSGTSRQKMINSILDRIRHKQNSVLSQLNDSRARPLDASIDHTLLQDSVVKLKRSIVKPISPESILLEKEKDARMQNITSKLQQLRADIRKQIVPK